MADRAFRAVLPTLVLALALSGCGPTVPQVVRIAPGQDLQRLVDRTPPGSTFVLATGEHRLATVQPRSGDRFIGEDGAVLKGSVEVDDWVAEGEVWTSGGHTTDSVASGDFLAGWQQEGNRQELFVDGERQLHVAGPADVGPGSWWFDVDGERLVMGTDPDGRLVELSVLDFAFRSPGADGVTIEKLEVTQYASLAQRGAIDAEEATNWTISEVVAHHNHGAGIRVDRGIHVVNSLIHDNGQIGLTGSQADRGHSRPVVVVGNEVRDNGVLHFTPFWESGGIKMTHSERAIVHDNVVTGNGGPGIWFDLGSTDAVITDNEVHDNAATGIFYEVSNDGMIARNNVTGNSTALPPELSSGIWLSNSGRTTVVDNTVAGNGNEIIMVAAPRQENGAPVAQRDVPDVIDNLIAGNDVTISDGFVGLSVVTGQDELYDSDRNAFRHNRYTLVACEPCFIWGSRVDQDGWRRLGNDAESTFDQEGQE